MIPSSGLTNESDVGVLDQQKRPRHDESGSPAAGAWCCLGSRLLADAGLVQFSRDQTDTGKRREGLWDADGNEAQWLGCGVRCRLARQSLRLLVDTAGSLS